MPPSVVAVPMRALREGRKKGKGHQHPRGRSQRVATYNDAIGETGRAAPATPLVAVAAAAVVLPRAVVVAAVVAWRGARARGATWACPGA